MTCRLIEYKRSVSKLTDDESIKRDLYLKRLNDGTIQGPLTGFPSLDKPWLKYYSDDSISFENPNSTAYEYLFEMNKDRLDYYAINYYGNRIKYRELFDKIDEVSSAFINLGIKEGDFVSFCMPTLPETIYSFYALNKIGAVCNFIDLRMNKERILKYINDTDSKIIVTLSSVSSKVYSIFEESTASTLIDISPSDSLKGIKRFLYRLKIKEDFSCDNKTFLTWDNFIKRGTENQAKKQGGRHDSPAAIVYTGGTTGDPKGAVLTNDCINLPSKQYGLADIPRGENDRFLNIMPPFIAYGLINGIHMPLSLGMELVLIPQFDPDEFSQIMKTYKPAHFVGIPMHFEKLMYDKRCEGMDLSYIQNAGCGGDAVPDSLEIEFNKFLKEHNCSNSLRTGFGMTENAAMSIYDLNNDMTKPGRTGIPMQRMNICVVDEDGNELGYDETGELMINSPEIIQGYYHREEETNKTIISIDGERWIKTGDNVSIDCDGNVKIYGRKKTMIIRPDGHNVWPDLIRDNLFGCPIIQDVCIVGVKSKYDSFGEIPTAIVVLKDGSMDKEEAKKEIFEYQSHLLGERDGAIDIRFRENLPLTPIGKIDSLLLTKEENKELSDIDFAYLTNSKNRA
jgi:long-chain acyl-CoA synthetase